VIPSSETETRSRGRSALRRGGASRERGRPALKRGGVPIEGASDPRARRNLTQGGDRVLTVYFGTPSMFITLWFGFDYVTNPPLGTLII
jgi:hypothetical protein